MIEGAVDRQIVSFTVPGTPAPQGSKVLTKFGGMREANKNTAPWRATVAWSARAAMRDSEPINEGVTVDVTFVFARPKSHYGTGKNADVLKNSAPTDHTVKPDPDKLARALLDGITGIVIRDDALVCSLHVEKAYGSPCARVTVARRRP